MGREMQGKREKKHPGQVFNEIKEKGSEQHRGIECPGAQELFYNIGEEKLNPDESRALDAHEASCPDCRAEFAAWREIRGALREAGKQVSPPPEFAAGVMARIKEERAAGAAAHKTGFRFLWSRVKGLTAAAVILALLTGSASFAARYWPRETGNYVADSGGNQEVNNPGEIKEAPGRGQVETNPGLNGLNPANQGQGPEAEAPAATREKEENPESTGAAGQVPQVEDPEQKRAVIANKPEETRVFLNMPRAIKTTMLKIAAADLERARSSSLEIARSAGAEVSSEVSAQNNGRKNIIIRFTLPPERAGAFLARLAALGNVILRDTTSQDITARFARTLEEYQALKAQRATAPESEKIRLDGQINFLAQQLQSWDQETGKQVIILWLEE